MEKKVAGGKEEGGEKLKNPGFSWWVLLAAVVGFAILSLVGAVVLVVLLLSLG